MSRHRVSGQTLEITEKFCYHGDAIGVRKGVVDSIITCVRSGWSNIRDLGPSLVSRQFSLGTKGTLHSASACSIMLCGIMTWPVKKEDTGIMQEWLDTCH